VFSTVALAQKGTAAIGGYTPPERSRKYSGALLVGYYSPSGLLFAGRVGTGFSEKALATLYDGMQKIRGTSCPFVNLPERRPGRWGQGITPAVFKRCTWVSRSWSPRSSSRSGPATTNCVNPFSWDCEPISRQRMSYVNNE